MWKKEKVIFKDTTGTDLIYSKIFICHVDDYIGSYNPDNGEIHYATAKEFSKFIKELLLNNPNHSPHNVTDPDIISIIRNKIQLDSILQNRIQNETRY